MPETRLSFNIIRLDALNSTNLYAAELLSEGEVPDGTVIVAREQYAGKGMDRNKWESAPGENLTFSLILHPVFLQVQHQFLLNKVIALGIYDFISGLLPGHKDIKVKWPNDIYIGDFKVAGILINNTITGETFVDCITGTGININQTVFISDAPNPVSLALVSGHEYDLEECLGLVLECLKNRYQQLADNQLKKLDRDYISVLYRFGIPAYYKYHGEMIKATMTGIDPYGRLRLQSDEKGELICDLKEISFKMSSL